MNARMIEQKIALSLEKKRENPKGKKIAAEISIENPLQIIVIMYRTLMHNCIPD